MLSLFLFFSTGLLDLADSYCEVRLKKICEELIKKSVSIDNVSNLLAAAVKYNATVSLPSVFMLLFNWETLSATGKIVEKAVW